MLLYIDPGTGSMIFTIVLSLLSVSFFFLQKVRLKIKSLIGRGGLSVQGTDHMPYVIFSDSKRYWNVFKPICDEFERRKIKVYYWTASGDDPALQSEYKYVISEYIGGINKASARLNVMNAGICISTTPGLDVYQWKRSRSAGWYVHIMHGIYDVTSYRMFGLDYYDAVLTTGQFQVDQIRKLEQRRNDPVKDIEIVGLTYLDTMKARYEEAGNEKHDRLTILLAPSWGESSILCRYGAGIIESLLNTGYRLIIRPHPQSMTSDKEIIEPLLKQYPDDDNISWNFDDDNFDALSSSDLMISDFSGVFFDYAFVFGRPVIYADTSFDKAPYDAAWLDEPMWVFEVLPKIGIPLKKEDFGRMKEVIDRAVNSEDLKRNLEEIRSSAWMHPGESAKLIVDYAVRKYQEHQKKDEESEVEVK
ncbi:MAG: CDP-glycerol glycerophosphotransferase family protein [Lachnospiraceae bacterium]|nr:CDP-glycerol glycerophosphotransferase family protein [Lachnospiraceae bacterium]